ncbi:MAG: pyridoxal-phosphate-dependent aminotransferase family protein [Desulfovibrio sp.]
MATDFDFAPLDLFITGPVLIRQEVREAGLLPEFGHRDTENEKRFGPIMAHLRTLAGVGDEWQPIILNGSGSVAMEATIRSLVADDETVLNVSVGAFGDLYHKLAVLNGKKAEQLQFEAGQAINLNVFEDALKKYAPQVVTFTHNETSTGVCNDIVACCELVRKYKALPLVDGVSIFGGADIQLKEAQPTTYATATQKSMGLPAGYGLCFLTDEALDKAKHVTNRGYSSDLVTQMTKAVKNQTLTTPNTTLANQMCMQLDYIVNVEGVDNRFARHLQLQKFTHNWVEAQKGLRLFAPEGFRSPTVTCVQTAQGTTVAELKQLKEDMRARGYLFDPGYGKLNTNLEAAGKPPVFRIGHMADLQQPLLEKYLKELSEAIAPYCNGR